MPGESGRTNFSGVNRDRNKCFPVQLTTSRVGNLIRLFNALVSDDDTHIYTSADPNTVITRPIR